jgi:hypothetical protein
MTKHKNQNSYQRVLDYLSPIFIDEVHLKRIESLTTAVYGTIQSGSIAIASIGKALGIFRGLNVKHAMKQVDRMFSNPGIDLKTIFPIWIKHLVGIRKEIVVALDWTDFAKDDQTTIALHLVTKGGRTAPLIWKTVVKSGLKDKQNDCEDELLSEFKDALSEDVQVTLIADRGFCGVAFFGFLNELGFKFIIRSRNNIYVTHKGEKKLSKDWLFATGKSRLLKDVEITNEGYSLSAFVCVHDKKMQHPWFLFSSLEVSKATEIVKLYGRRFTIEESFRDIKDMRYGMGLSTIKVSKPIRRDRMLLVCTLAFPLLTLLGAAGEAIGMDRMLKVNTSKARTHSLLNQGCYYFSALMHMDKEKMKELLDKFNELLSEQKALTTALGWT